MLRLILWALRILCSFIGCAIRLGHLLQFFVVLAEKYLYVYSVVVVVAVSVSVTV